MRDLIGPIHPHGTYTDISQFSLAFSEFVLQKDITANCRVKRHLISTSIHEHGTPVETKPAPAFYTHRPNTTEANTNPRSQTLFKSSNNTTQSFAQNLGHHFHRGNPRIEIKSFM